MAILALGTKPEVKQENFHVGDISTSEALHVIFGMRSQDQRVFISCLIFICCLT
jgi:hypothetical protein